MHTKLSTLLFASIFCLSNFTTAQIANKSPLNIETIMQRSELYRGTEPSNLRWNSGSEALYFDWNPNGDTLASLYKIGITMPEPVAVDPPGRQPAPLFYNFDRSLAGFVREGNIYLFNTRTKRERLLTSLAHPISGAGFSSGDRLITFVHQQNLYSVDVSSGTLRQLTLFTANDAQGNRSANAQSDWLRDQQSELFDVLRERHAIEKAQERQLERMAGASIPRIAMGRERPLSISISPSERFIAYTTSENVATQPTSVTHFVTTTGYTNEQTARTKVGSPQPVVRLWVFDTVEKKSIEVKSDQLPGITDLPDFLSDYPERFTDTKQSEPRKVNFSAPIWNHLEDKALVIARSHDNKDRWICILDPSDGMLTSLDRQRDEAWIAGPGISGFSGSAGWLHDHESVWFQSEESGYSHLISQNVKTGFKNQLTTGNWEVYAPQLSANGRHFYFTANLMHPGIRHFYKIPVQGGEPVQITTMDGGNEVLLSPDEKWLAIRHSKANEPWEVYLQENKPGGKVRQITRSLTPEFTAYPWRVPEFVTYTASDGAEVHARLYRPDLPLEQGPAVIFVHGAGYLQNAHQWWSSYFREYMFHNLLVDNGYTVLDIDFRGSAGYGRDWRTGIYRHMGGKDLSDHVDGAAWLVETQGIASHKIGIYGGSYGGFITLMAMFLHPDVFAAGAALRSVTDWAHYNHGYTSNILNTPVLDSIAYVRSSPIYYAHGLKGALLMCHGMVDDNVQFQDIVRLTQRLIELGKENWELAIYPVESHAFAEPSSWIDEYRRIYKLFEENLK